MPEDCARDEAVDWPVIEGRAESIGHLLREPVASDASRPALQHVRGGAGHPHLAAEQVENRARELAAGLLDRAGSRRGLHPR